MQFKWLGRVMGLALAATLMACGGVEPDAAQAVDGPDDSFLAGGKADTAGLTEGSPDALAVLKLASTASLIELKDQVGLYSLSAQNIVDYRAQKGAGFDTLKELDDVKYVGPVALWSMLSYVNQQGLVGPGGTQIYGEGDPIHDGDYSYVLHDTLLLKEYEQVYQGGSNTFVVWQLNVKADYLALDSKNNRLIAFGANNLYIINPAGWVEKVYDQGYDDIPNLKTDLLAGSAVCGVYKNLASYYQGKALGAYMVGNIWAGNLYTWWRYYFEGLASFSFCG